MHRFIANLLCPLLLLYTACAVDTVNAVENVNDTAEALVQADPTPFICGYALSGYSCDNGRGHIDITATSMQAAIASCHAQQPASLPDFCYVIDTENWSGFSETQCAEAGGSWRPANSCCNFMGTLSCPAQSTYRCGYALAGYNCNNGRGSVLLSAPDMTTAIATCHTSQPASLPDFCYVKNTNQATPSDPTQCAAAVGSWRPASVCCNFKGSLSCP